MRAEEYSEANMSRDTPPFARAWRGSPRFMAARHTACDGCEILGTRSGPLAAIRESRYDARPRQRSHAPARCDRECARSSPRRSAGLDFVPKWRNWQTRGTQNPVRLKPRVGSTPTFGTTYSLRHPPLYERSDGLPRRRLDEREQVGVDSLRMGGAHAVRQTGIDHERRIAHEPGRQQSGRFDRHDLIVAAVHDESGHVELLQVVREVRLEERLKAIDHCRNAGLHGLADERIAHIVRERRTGSIAAVVRQTEIPDETSTVHLDAIADFVE